jgi:hypothetical protein
MRLLIRADETDRAEPPVFDTTPKGMTVGPWEMAYVLVAGMVWRCPPAARSLFPPESLCVDVFGPGWFFPAYRPGWGQ